MERQSTPQARVNTYLNKEMCKIIIIAATPEKADEFSSWLTENQTKNRGIYTCKYNRTTMIVFPRTFGQVSKSVTTVAVEGIFGYVTDASELEDVIADMEQYGAIPVRLIVSVENLIKKMPKNKDIKWVQKSKPDEVKNVFDNFDREELKRIKAKFEAYDTDKSGSIEAHEMKEIAKSLGLNTSTEEFHEAMMALDFNGDGDISFSEFIAWWKIGRQNTATLPKIYRLSRFVQDLINNAIDYPSFVREIGYLNQNNDVRSNNQLISFRSPGMFELKSFFNVHFSIGGNKRIEMAIDFLKQFTSNPSPAKDNWVSLLVHLKPKMLSPQRVKELLDSFKENLIKWGEANSNPTFISFVKNLLIFETSATENAGILVTRLKLDIESLVKNGIKDLIYIIQNIGSQTTPFWFKFSGRSNQDLAEPVNETTNTIGEFLKVSEVEFEGSSLRNRLKQFVKNLKGDMKGLGKLLQFLYVPYDLNLEFEGDLNDLSDVVSQRLLDVKLDQISSFLVFLKENLSPQLIKATKSFEVALNAFDMFARINLSTKALMKVDKK